MFIIRLPFDSNGEEIAVTQGPGEGSHGDPTLTQLYYSWDFALPVGSEILAVADGVIVDIRATVPDGAIGTVLPNMDGDGDPSNDDPSLGSGGIGNIVTIRHDVDGQTFYSSYFHLAENSIPFTPEEVAAGTATVSAGDVIGLSGLTGSREGVSGAHLHFQVGETAGFFGGTNYGGWPDGTDNARPQFIAIASPENEGVVSFNGYGTTLPARVVGSTQPPAEDNLGIIKIGGEFKIDTDELGEPANYLIRPAAISLSNGNYAVVWEENFTSNNIKVVLLNADGEFISNEIVANNGLLGGSSAAEPALASSANGSILVSWSQFVASWDADENPMATGGTYEIFAQVMSLDGEMIGSAFQINSNSVGSQTNPKSISLNNGSYLVTWQLDEGSRPISGVIIDEFGVFVSGELELSDSSFNGQHAIAQTTGSGFIVTVFDAGRVLAREFSETGEPIGEEFVIDDRAISVLGAEAVISPDGRLILVTSEFSVEGDLDQSGIVLRIFDTATGILETKAKVNDETVSYQVEPSIVLTESGFVVSWSTLGSDFDDSGYGINAQAYDFAGNKLGAQSLLNTSTAENQGGSSLASGVDGNILAVWFDDADTAAGNLSSIKGQLVGVQDGQVAGAPSIEDPGLITLSGGTVNVFDLTATDDRDSEGAGLSFTNSPAPDQLNFSVNPNTGEITFNFVPTGDPAEDADGDGIHELTVEVTDSDGLSDTVNLFVQVVPEPPSDASASTLELEYFARETAYADADIELLQPGSQGPLVFVGDVANGTPYESFLDGWTLTGEFEGGRYRAVVLEKDGFQPVLAVRGTAFAMDWIENFDLLGVGFSEAVDLYQAETTLLSGQTLTLGDWLFQNPSASITGHSQGGAIAMTLSSLAVDSRVSLTGELATFNSPGVSVDVVEGRNFDFENVTHFVSNGDIVSLVGSEYISGDVHFYDVDVPNYPANPVTFITGSHTQHWAQVGLANLFSDASFLSEYQDGFPFEGYNVSPAVHLPSVETTGQLASPFFSFRTQHPGEDGEFAFFDAYASVFSAGAFGLALTNRATLEASRDVVSLFLETVQASGKVISGLGDFVLDSTEGALLQTWSSANDLASWIGDRFAPSEDVVVAVGNHAGSTPAIVLNVEGSDAEVLSSSASGSIFLLTDPGTTIDLESGNNIIWGVAGDQADTYVSGGVSETDAHFIQNAFFDTGDLDLESGSAIIRVDLDQDGENDFTITWEGSYRLESIVAEQGVDGTYIRYLGNALPEATNDAFATSESEAITTGSVLANDLDGDGDALSITGVDVGGTQGLVTYNGDGTFDYNPNGAFDDLLAGEMATDTFVYLVSDGVATVRGEVTVTINGEDEPEPESSETVDIDFVQQGIWGRTTAEITVTDADGTVQADTQALGWFFRKIVLEEAGVKFASKGPGFDTVSAIQGALGVSSRIDAFSIEDRLDIDRKESLKISLVGEDEIATRLLLDFAEQEGDVRLVFFNDGERMSAKAYDYEDGMVELTDLAFDEVWISGSGQDDVRVTGIEFDRVNEVDSWMSSADSFEFI